MASSRDVRRAYAREYYKRYRARQSIARDNRDFVGWDGEGYSAWPVDSQGVCYGKKHFYCLFGNTLGLSQESVSLGTLECLELLIESKERNPDVINISFAFDYDVNMILGDMDERHLRKLRKYGVVYWWGYRIEHRPKKWFQISRRRSNSSDRIAIRVYDIFSYFAQSFVRAATSFLGESEALERVKAGKNRRGNFSYVDLPGIRDYWTEEGQLLVELANALRAALWSANIRISSWHGPGAVATSLFQRYNVQQYMDRDIPKEVNEAARYAYSSGRFEPFAGGFYEGPIWIADIHNAYPFALSQLPRLDRGSWERLGEDQCMEVLTGKQPPRMGIFHIDYTGGKSLFRDCALGNRPALLFYRSDDNRIHYPVRVEGWYYSPEAQLAARDRESARILEGWVFRDDGTYPFEWVIDLYHERLRLKAEGNAGEKGIKLGLNSAYGKMAQRIGWDETARKPPRFHQLEWAGTITSETRANIYGAALGVAQKGGLISIDTDGIISRVPFEFLPYGVGDELGQWEIQEYTGILYLQNGVYWLRDKNGTWLPPKSRGIPREQLSFEAGMRSYRTGQPLVCQQHTFVGYGTALRGRLDIWRTWVDSPRRFEFGGSGKRIHSPKFCHRCVLERSNANGLEQTPLHNFILSRPGGGISNRHRLPWLEEIQPEDVDMEMAEDRRWGIVDF